MRSSARDSRQPPTRAARFWFICAFVLMMIPSARFNVGPFTLLPEHLAIPILLLVWMGNRPRANVRPRSAPWTVAWLAATILWWLFTLVASAFVAPSAMESLRLLIWICANVLACALVFALRAMVESVIRPLVAAVTIAMLVSLFGWVAAQISGTANDFVESDYATALFRLEGLFDEPNLYAAFLTLTACTIYVWRSAMSAGLLWVFLLVGSVSVYLTFTRVAWVLWAAVTAAFAIRQFGRSKGVLVAIPLIAALVILVLGATPSTRTAGSDPLLSATIGRLSALFDLDRGTGLTRSLTIDSALQDLTMHGAWLTGFGFNGYSQMHDAGVTSYAAAYLPTLWVAIFYDGGILAGVFFILAVAIFWFATARVGSSLFVISFALLAAATNNTWFAFPWVLGAIIAGRASIPQRTAASLDPAISVPRPFLSAATSTAASAGRAVIGYSPPVATVSAVAPDEVASSGTYATAPPTSVYRPRSR